MLGSTSPPRGGVVLPKAGASGSISPPRDGPVLPCCPPRVPASPACMPCCPPRVFASPACMHEATWKTGAGCINADTMSSSIDCDTVGRWSKSLDDFSDDEENIVPITEDDDVHLLVVDDVEAVMADASEENGLDVEDDV
ncbi:hypothetical protein V6N13_033511 [Hibiscus sabdariffa]